MRETLAAWLWTLLAAIALVGLVTNFGLAGEPAGWAGLYASAPHRCVTCQFDCTCGTECKCPQVARVENARVREPAAAPEGGRSATPKAGEVRLHAGYFYRLSADGWWHWCDECNGETHPAAVARLTPKPAAPVFTSPYVGTVPVVFGNRVYYAQAGGCATGNCGTR